MSVNSRLAELGTVKKKSPKNAMYYVNRAKYAFSFPQLDKDGKRKTRTNPHTGMPLLNSKGEPEYIETTVEFRPWRSRFTDLGYWSCYEVTPETDPELAKELERMASSNKHEIMTEKAFIEYTNPVAAEQFNELVAERAEKEKAISALSKAEEEIARLKQKANIR